MPSKSVNITIHTPLADIQIYADPKKQAKAEKLIKSMPHIIENAYIEGATKFSQQLLKIIRKCLKSGVPPKGVSWQPHAENTKKRYGEHTLLNWIGQYLRSVRLVRQKNRIFVGLPYDLRKTRKGKNGKATTSTKTLNQIAIILEYGTMDYIPPRPLWGPAYKEVGGDKLLQKKFLNAIRKQVRKYM